MSRLLTWAIMGDHEQSRMRHQQAVQAKKAISLVDKFTHWLGENIWFSL
jgi:hypothetical protein